MARPTNKVELLEQANGQFKKLQKLIESMSEELQLGEFSFVVTEKDKEAHWLRDKNLRDVLVHLYEWHVLLLDWVSNNLQNVKVAPVPFLPVPYSWKNYRGMNEEFTAKHQATSLEEAKELLQTSHNAVVKLINKFSDEELFTKAYFN